MIGYLDTSAFVPLLLDEPSGAFCRQFWQEADDVASSRLLYVEAAAALASATRSRRVSESQRQASLRALDRLAAEVYVIEVDSLVVHRAAQLAHDYALRGYDAVHCASAERIDGQDLIVATGDQRLLDACQTLGLATADVNAGSS